LLIIKEIFMKDKLVMLVVLDGYGLNELEEGNAIKAAKTPNMDKFFSQYPNTIIHASGLDVGCLKARWEIRR